MKKKTLVWTLPFCSTAIALGLYYHYYQRHVSGNSIDMINYQGIDVSHHQGRINWVEVASDTNIHFAYLKSTEGSTFIHKEYKRKITESRKRD